MVAGARVPLTPRPPPRYDAAMPRVTVVILGALVAASVAMSGVAYAQQPAPIGETDGPPREREAPIIEVLTFGVGELLFERFGHTAVCIRYHDPNRSPVCFNYGVTDFDSGAVLAWRFLRGEQQFWVEPMDFRPLLEIYQDEDRDIWAQPLPLSDTEARAIETRLWSDLSDDRRFYIYDHFANNCTTRIRDIIDEATGGRLHIDGERRYPLALRELVHRGFAEMPALVALSDFVLGRELDEHPTVWQAMFHPRVFQQQLEIRFSVKPEIVSSRHGSPYRDTGSSGRFVMLLVALAFTLPLVIARWRPRFERAALVWTTLHLATWGIVIYGVVIISSIGALRWNEAVLVLTPVDAVLPWLSNSRRRRYTQVRVLGLLLVSSLCALGILHQPLWIPILTAVMPLTLIAFPRRR